MSDRQKIFNQYLAQEAGFTAAKLAFLDRGIARSPYAADVAKFPDRLKQKPNGVNSVSSGATAVQTGTNAVIPFKVYPARGKQPTIRVKGLDFLHADILQACVCMGSFVDGMIWTNWLGKNALQPAQLWSTTKILPLLQVVSQANTKNPKALIRDCLVREGQSSYSFYNLAVDLISYGESIATSNAIAATFKQFSTPSALEDWVEDITGNYSLQFQGRYGEPPLFAKPTLWNPPLKTVLLASSAPQHLGNNLVSTYDLVRLISLVGWHNHLFPQSRLPGAQWSSLETVVRALGTDPARYVDVAIQTLGLADSIESPVILSKLGFGRSDSRDRTELAYVAFVQFLDKRRRPSLLRTFSLALLGASAAGDENEEARRLDARMAAEVTEILRRVLSQELV